MKPAPFQCGDVAIVRDMFFGERRKVGVITGLAVQNGVVMSYKITLDGGPTIIRAPDQVRKFTPPVRMKETPQ